ncbi:hypothetical protein [Pseudoalteromonas sp. Of7M-16]|uniref:hypothetical protein n=1 Tax=Pseudoalteromonas sp. Of7M-16 TaxID=2917756 RepID=UPI001EF5E846|nr:hypothetical protein [Pseudoalteromonas sp. Of7M-16]MCG7551368.1 hypothetical protein [Pseudoalteromonas sp. Of7M-16]
MHNHHIRANLKVLSLFLMDSSTGLTQEQAVELGVVLDGLVNEMQKSSESKEAVKVSSEL